MISKDDLAQIRIWDTIQKMFCVLKEGPYEDVLNLIGMNKVLLPTRSSKSNIMQPRLLLVLARRGKLLILLPRILTVMCSPVPFPSRM